MSRALQPRAALAPVSGTGASSSRRWLGRQTWALALTGALAVAGGGMAIVPTWASSIVAVTLAGAAVVMAATALSSIADVADREAPPPRPPQPDSVEPLDPPGLVEARRALRGSSHRITPGARRLDRPAASADDPTVTAAPLPVPPDTWRSLVVAAAIAFDRHGLDLDHPESRARAAALVAPEVWATIAVPPARIAPVDPAVVAATVHRVLDALDRIAATRLPRSATDAAPDRADAPSSHGGPR